MFIRDTQPLSDDLDLHCLQQPAGGYNNTEKTSTITQPLYEQAHGHSGKQKLPFNRKKPGNHLLWLVRSERRTSMRQGASPQLSEHLPDDFGLSAFRFVEAICISTPVVMEVMEHIRMVE